MTKTQQQRGQVQRQKKPYKKGEDGNMSSTDFIESSETPNRKTNTTSPSVEIKKSNRPKPSERGRQWRARFPAQI